MPDPELEKTLEEHIEWVNQASELAISEGYSGIQRAIDALEDDQLRGTILVLVTTCGAICKAIRERITPEQFEGLESHGSARPS